MNLCPYIAPEKFIEVDGIKICYLESGHGHTIILVHGLGGSIDNWDPTFEYFKTRFRTIAIDLPGYGKSDKPDIDYSIPFFSDTIAKFMDSKGINKAVVIGHSMGGLIAINFSRRYLTRLHAIVLVDGVEFIGTPAKAAFGLKLLCNNILTHQIKNFFHWTLKYFPLDNLMKYLFKKLLFYRPNIYAERFFQRKIAEARGSPEFAKFLNALVKCGQYLSRTLPKKKIEEIKVPILIICGAKDRLFSLAQHRRFHEQVTNSSLVVIPNCGHVPQLERAEIFNQSVESFLTELLI